jgi:hypothetical protein
MDDESKAVQVCDATMINQGSAAGTTQILKEAKAYGPSLAMKINEALRDREMKREKFYRLHLLYHLLKLDLQFLQGRQK